MSYRRPSLLNDISVLRMSTETDVSSSIGPDGFDHDSTTGGALSSSPIDEISASRPLTEDEITAIESLIRDTLLLANSPCALQAEADAQDLINFAIELITDEDDAERSTVGALIEELEYMGLAICGPSSLSKMRLSLAEYICKKVNGAKSLPGEDCPKSHEAFKERRRRSLASEMRESEMHVAGIDLSAKTAAKKKREELASLTRQGSSLKDRMKMFNQDGNMRASFTNPDEDDLGLGDGIDDFGELDLNDPSSIQERRQAELRDVLDDVTLTEKEQTDKMKQVRAKFGMLEMKLRISKAQERYSAKEESSAAAVSENAAPEAVPRAEREMKAGKRRSSIDLSAKNAASMKREELKSLTRQGSSIKDRMKMFNKNGSIRASFDNPGVEEEDQQQVDSTPKEKTAQELRREELFHIMRDRSLSREEKTMKMDEVRARYATEDDEVKRQASSDESSGPSQEQAITATASSDEEAHKKELRSIVRDRTLTREERSKKMALARWRHANNHQPQDNGSSDEDSHGTIETAATTKASVVDLSAKGYADRRRASLESLANSFSSNDDSGGSHVMSVKERLSMYSNNEFVVTA